MAVAPFAVFFADIARDAATRPPFHDAVAEFRLLAGTCLALAVCVLAREAERNANRLPTISGGDDHDEVR